MSYTKREFGARLEEQLDVGYDVVKIGRWTYQEFLEHCIELEIGLKAEMMRIIAMEEGIEFELTEQEIRTLAEELQK